MKSNARSSPLFLWTLGSLICLECIYLFVALASPVHVNIPMVGPLRKEFRVLVPDEYTLWLRVDSNGPKNDLTATLKSIPWPTLTPPLIPVPVKWSISAGDSRKIGEGSGGDQKIIDEGIRNSDSNIDIALFRGILGFGSYTMSAEAGSGFQALQAANPHLLLQTNFKQAATWQRSLLNLFAIAQMGILPIVLVMMAIFIYRQMRRS